MLIHRCDGMFHRQHSKKLHESYLVMPYNYIHILVLPYCFCCFCFNCDEKFIPFDFLTNKYQWKHQNTNWNHIHITNNCNDFLFMSHTWALSHGFKHSSKYKKFILDYIVKIQKSITLSRNHINLIIYVISHNVYNSQLTWGDQVCFQFSQYCHIIAITHINPHTTLKPCLQTRNVLYENLFV
jgi:hypothetical protein